MKKGVIVNGFLLVSLFLSAQERNCTIHVSTQGMQDGQQIFLTVGSNTHPATIHDGSANFSEQIDKASTGYLMLREPKGIVYKYEFKYIYLLPGTIDVTVNDKDSIFKATVKGPALTVAYDRELRLPVDRYNLQTYLLNIQLAKARKENRDTTQLKEQLESSIKACFNVPQVYIKANPSSPLSIVALDFLGNGNITNPVHLEDLERLYNSLSDEIKHSEEGLRYAEKLNKLKATDKMKKTTSTDGPYLFYANDSVTVKNTIVSGTSTIHVFPIESINKQVLHVDIDKHPDWGFTVSLKSAFIVPPSISSGPERALYLSDIEGEFAVLRQILLDNKVIDENYHWIFGKGALVIAGDLMDRGNEVTQVLWLLYKLEDEAIQQGGSVHVILGNHEIMNLSGDFRYLQPAYLNNAALIKENYANLYAANTELGRWLRTKNVIEQIGNVLVMHGGISPEVLQLQLPLDSINALCKSNYATPAKDLRNADTRTKVLFGGTTSPFWYRGYFNAPKASMSLVDSTLAFYNCKQIIVGHTIVDYVSSLYDGKVWGIDVDEHTGTHEALLKEGEKWKVVKVEMKK